MSEQMLEERVRTGLAALAGPPVGPDEAMEAVRRVRSKAARRRHQATVWLAAAAVAMLLVGAGATRLLLPAPGTTTSSAAASITSWTARGDLAGNTALITDAERVWRAGAPAGQRPGATVRTLFAGTDKAGDDTIIGTVVVLLSTQADTTLVGILSTAVNLSGPPQPGPDLLLRSVVTVDPGQTIRSVGFIAPGVPADRPNNDMGAALGYVLLAPGITAGDVQSSMVDSIMTDTDRLPTTTSGLLDFQGFAGSGPWNSWVLTPKGTPGIDVLGGAIGDPTYTPGHVDSTGTVTSDADTPVHAGDLVVAHDNRPAGDGLLGVIITTAAGATGKVDPSLTNLDRWNLHALSLNNYRGVLSRTANGALVFTTASAQTPNGVSRVLAQTTDGRVTLNVGVFSPTPPGEPNTTSPYPLEQANTLPATGTEPVWIIATGR